MANYPCLCWNNNNNFIYGSGLRFLLVCWVGGIGGWCGDCYYCYSFNSGNVQAKANVIKSIFFNMQTKTGRT